MRSTGSITQDMINFINDSLTDETKEMILKMNKISKYSNKNTMRRIKYNRLREAGYNSKIAGKYKDYAMKHIDSLCSIKKEVDSVLWERVNKALQKTL